MENHSHAGIASVIAEHIVITPGVCGGKPRIAGHRIKVQHIVVWHEKMGLSPDQIASQHPGITLSDIYAALAFYWDHRAQIDEDIQDDEKFLTEMQAKAAPSLLREKLTQNAQDDSISSG